MSSNKRLTLGKIVFIGSIIILLYALFNSIGGDILLKENGACIRGVLYKKTYGGKTKPSLGYKFFFNGKEHTGLVVQDGILKIGDSICVVYLPSFPSVNRPVSYFDKGEIKCDCK